MAATPYQDAFPAPTADRWEGQREIQRVRPYVHEDTGLAPQEAFLAGPEGDAPVASDARDHAFVSGLGAGKTAAGVVRAWANAERWNAGELGMIVAPTVPALKNAILPVMREFGLLGPCEYRGKGAEEPGIHTPSGSRIILESADNDRKIERLRGPNLAWVWMDEAASISERAWEILAGRLRTGDYRNAFVTTTPKGRNWVYERFYEGEDRTAHRSDPYEVLRVDDRRGVFGVPSWLNPHNPEDYVERLEREYEGQFYEQEVLGAFTDFDGLVFPWFDADEHVVDDAPAPGGYDEAVYGVDWGHNNPAVAVAIVRHGDRWTVAEEWYERRCTVNDHARALEDLVKRYGAGPIYCDPSEPANVQTLQRNDLDARGAENAVTPGIQHVASLRDGLRVAAHCQNVRNEFSQYQYKDGGDSDDPLKQHDHAMDALRYALFSHEAKPTIRRRNGGGPTKGNLRNS